MAANNIARLGVVLGLDSAEFITGLDAANKKLYDFGVKVADQSKLALTALGTAFVASTFEAMRFADEIADVAKANDVAIDTIIKLNNALANSGGKAEDSGKLLASFTKYMDGAATGSFEAQQSLAKMGVSLNDIANLKTEDLFKRIVKSVSEIEDPLTRNARAMDIFGKAAKGVDFVGVADEMDKVNTMTDYQAQAIKDSADAFDMFNQHARDVKFTMASEIGTSLKQTIDYFVDLFSTVNQGGGLWKSMFDKMAYGVAFMAFEVKDLVRVMGSWGDAYSAIVEGRWSDLDKIAQKRMQERNADEAKLITLDKQMSAPSGAPSPWDNPTVTLPKRPGQTSGPMRTVTPGVDKEAAAARRQAEADARRLAREAEAAAKKQADLEKKGFEVAVQQREEAQRAIAQENDAYTRGEAAMRDKQRMQETQMERDQEMFLLEQRGVDLKREDLQLSRDVLQLENRRKDAIEEINSNKNLDPDARAKALAKENDLYEKGVQLAMQRNQVIKDAQIGTVEQGWTKAMDKYIDNLPTQLKRGEELFSSFTDVMGSAVDQFVEKGSVAWDKLIENMLKGMLKAEMQRQATQIFGGGLSALFDYFRGGSSVIPLQAGGGYADGGDPPVGKVSMVGERGPELFVPKTAGTIIPNNMLNASFNAPTINYNGPYIANMSAIDTQSGAQFLAKNKQAVWATYQSANRSIPMSR